MINHPINLEKKFKKFTDQWSPKVIGEIWRDACAANVGVISARKNGPSADTVVMRAITVSRYVLFCRTSGTYIHGVTTNLQ